MCISDIGIVELSGMEFFARHGCLESERRDGNTFSVDFKASYDISRAAQTDNLRDAVDYSRIYDMVKKEMEKPSNLLEHVAARIVEAIKYEFPDLEDISVRVTKFNPPVDGKVRSSSVTAKG